MHRVARQKTPQVRHHFAHGGVAFGRMPTQCFQHDRIDIGRHRESGGLLAVELSCRRLRDTAWRHHDAADDGVGQQVRRHQMLERPPPGHQLVKHHAQRIDVRGGGQRLAFDLFRAGIGQGQRLGAGGGGGNVNVFVDDSRNAEIQQLRLAIFRYQDIRRLDVAMDDEVAMGVLHRRAHLKEQQHALAQVGPMVFAPGIDALALDVLHRQERLAVCQHAAIEQMRNARMLQPRQHLPLAGEALQQHRRAFRRRLQEFQRHLLHEITVGALGQVDRAHAAFTQAAQQAVMPGRRGLRIVAAEVGRLHLVAGHRRGVAALDRADHPAHFAAELLVAGHRRRDHFLARIHAKLDRRHGDKLRLAIAIRQLPGHPPPPCWPVSIDA